MDAFHVARSARMNLVVSDQSAIENYCATARVCRSTWWSTIRPSISTHSYVLSLSLAIINVIFM